MTHLGNFQSTSCVGRANVCSFLSCSRWFALSFSSLRTSGYNGHQGEAVLEARENSIIQSFWVNVIRLFKKRYTVIFFTHLVVKCYFAFIQRRLSSASRFQMCVATFWNYGRRYVSKFKKLRQQHVPYATSCFVSLSAVHRPEEHGCLRRAYPSYVDTEKWFCAQEEKWDNFTPMRTYLWMKTLIWGHKWLKMLHSVTLNAQVCR